MERPIKSWTGFSAFALLLSFWILPWRLLVPTVHAQTQLISRGDSIPINFALAPPAVAPQATCVSQAPAGTHGTTVCWTASASATVTGYNVYVATTAGGPYTKQNAAPIAGTSFFFSTANAGGVKDFIVVRSFDGTAESGNSNEISTTTIGNPLPPTAVQAVSV
jgi:hypothetical protein